MKRQTFGVFFLLILAAIIGSWLGDLARPENHQLRGELAFDPTQIPSADYEVGNFMVKWRIENGGQLLYGKQSQAKHL